MKNRMIKLIKRYFCQGSCQASGRCGYDRTKWPGPLVRADFDQTEPIKKKEKVVVVLKKNPHYNICTLDQFIGIGLDVNIT
jgi:hypothetical protein